MVVIWWLSCCVGCLRRLASNQMPITSLLSNALVMESKLLRVHHVVTWVTLLACLGIFLVKNLNDLFKLYSVQIQRTVPTSRQPQVLDDWRPYHTVPYLGIYLDKVCKYLSKVNWCDSGMRLCGGM